MHPKRKTTAVLLPVVLLAAGCSTVYYKDECVAFEIHKYATFESAQRILIAEKPAPLDPKGNRRGPCTVHVDVTGAESDQVRAIGVAVDSAVSAAIKGAKPL